MTGGGLSATTYEYVGNSGVGTFIQSGGTNSIGGYLFTGYNSSSSGTYSLSSGYLSVPNNGYEYLGYSGTGNFTQSGGTNNCGYLIMGNNTGGSGSYSLSGGYLLVPNYENVGYSGTGTFTQSGGTNVCNYLWVSIYSGGTYSFSSGYLLVADNANVGYDATGTFAQTGGTHNIGEWLFLGYDGSGTYNLSGSGYLSASGTYSSGGSTYYGEENFGYYGKGTFAQSGGTNSCIYISIGSYVGSGTYSLGNGYLSVNQATGNTQENVGDYSTGLFLQTGGTNSCGFLNIGNQPGSSGTYSLGGSGYLTASGTYPSGYSQENVGYSGTGTFTQTGGTNSCTYLSIGVAAGSPGGSGTYSLSNGYLSVNQANGNTQENVGDYSKGLLLQTGGTNSCGYLNVGNQPGSSGAYSLSGSGYLTASATFSSDYSEENVALRPGNLHAVRRDQQLHLSLHRPVRWR